MCVKLCLYILFSTFALIRMENHDWDLAVAISDRIKLFRKDKFIAEQIILPYGHLKTITFDYVHGQLIASDQIDNKSTFFSVGIAKESEVHTLMENVTDDVQGIAIDPINAMLLWTDADGRRIRYVLLNTKNEPKTLISFDTKAPQAISVHICTGDIYWINAELDMPSIEKIVMNGKSVMRSQVLIDKDVIRPSGLVVDEVQGRVYWTDMRTGIYYSIESADLNGKHRTTIERGTHAKPYHIVVNNVDLYWTDFSNNALCYVNTSVTTKPSDTSSPNTIYELKNDRPVGVVLHRSYDMLLVANVNGTCNRLSNATDSTITSKHDKLLLYNSNIANKRLHCFNNGTIVKNHNGSDSCQCVNGYRGHFCEISLCHDFCLNNAECFLTEFGDETVALWPRCECSEGFVGSRCEVHLCDNFCLNNGVCSILHRKPQCYCSREFVGHRCELPKYMFEEVCAGSCELTETASVTMENNTFYCRCDTTEIYNSTASKQLAGVFEEGCLYGFEGPFISTIAVLAFLLVVAIGLLTYCTFRLKRRPRIKKRIIVNKNITPLTYRAPDQGVSEQCEITIENCCNMNVCETPCFEPPRLTAFHCPVREDKRQLLRNGEYGEEFY